MVSEPRRNQQQEANDKVNKSFQQCQRIMSGPGVWGTPGRQAVKGWRTDRNPLQPGLGIKMMRGAIANVGQRGNYPRYILPFPMPLPHLLSTPWESSATTENVTVSVRPRLIILSHSFNGKTPGPKGLQRLYTKVDVHLPDRVHIGKDHK